LIALSTALFLGGCNKAFIVEDPVTSGTTGSNTTLIILDSRPASDIEHSFGSMLVTSSEYGIWTLGDKHFTPTLDELLKIRIHRHVAALAKQPATIEIELKRMIVQSNQQADLLQSVSTGGQLGPLGVAIAELMHGKEFELDYDKTRPFVIGLIDSNVKVSFTDGTQDSKKISVSKAINFTHHMDYPGREKAAVEVVNNLFDAFVQQL